MAQHHGRGVVEVESVPGSAVDECGPDRIGTPVRPHEGACASIRGELVAQNL